MRATLRKCLQIKPIPISSIKSPKSELRLPPTISSKSSGSSTSTPKARRQTPVLDNLEAYQRKCLEKQSGNDQIGTEGLSWPRNLRLERQINKRDLFWKVPKEQRDILRNHLKEA